MDGRSAGSGVVTDVDQPVFVDSTGQRRRVTVIAGVSIAVGLLVSLGLVIAGLFGGSSVPLPGWSDTTVQQGDPFDTVLPTTTPDPTATGKDDGPPRNEPATRPSTRTTSDRPGAGNPTPPGLSRRPSKSPGKPK